MKETKTLKQCYSEDYAFKHDRFFGMYVCIRNDGCQNKLLIKNGAARTFFCKQSPYIEDRSKKKADAAI